MYSFNNMKNSLPEGDDKKDRREQGENRNSNNGSQPRDQGYGNNQPQGQAYGATQPKPQGQSYGNNQPQGQAYGATQPKPQGQSYGNNQPQGQTYGATQPKPQGQSYGNNQPQGQTYGATQPKPQGQSYGNNQPQGQAYGATQPKPQGFSNMQSQNSQNAPLAQKSGGAASSDLPSTGYGGKIDSYNKQSAGDEEETQDKGWMKKAGIAAGVLAAAAGVGGAIYGGIKHSEHKKERREDEERKQEEEQNNDVNKRREEEDRRNDENRRREEEDHRNDEDRRRDEDSRRNDENRRRDEDGRRNDENRRREEDERRNQGDRNQEYSQNNNSPANCQYAQISQPRSGVIVNCQRMSLKHEATGKYLAVGTNYLSEESKQQLAYAKDNRDDECWWLVVPVNGDRTPEGDPLVYGTQVRLYNVKSGTYLHSHPNFKSPVSQQHEVTSYGSKSSSDTNDHWIAERFSDGGHTLPWSSNYPVVFKHTNTGNYLHSHEVRAQNGSNEVTSYEDSQDQNNKWVMEL